MSELRYRTEAERVADRDADPVASGDPFRPHTEAERIYEFERGIGPIESDPALLVKTPGGLLRHPDTGHLVGIEQAPIPAPLAQGATIAADKSDQRRLIGAQEAANRIRDEFKPVVVEPKYLRHEKFLTAVAGHLGADPNPANLEQIAELLGKSEVTLPDHEYPKMLYGRMLPDAEHGFETHVNLRHDHVGVIARNEEDAKKLGGGWVENPADLPKRKEGEARGDFPASEKQKGADQKANPKQPHDAHDHHPDPVGWDDGHAVVRRANGSIDLTATNDERCKRGIALLPSETSNIEK